MSPEQKRLIEKNFHITKLKLLEIFPLFPYLMNKDNLVCLEIGANKGLWLEGFMEIFGPQVQTYHAFEPVLPTYKELNARIEAYFPEYQSFIHTHQSCVGDALNDIEIHYREQNTTLASILIKETHIGQKVIPNDKSAMVAQTTIDKVMSDYELENVDFMKVDVEGYEWNVFQGMEDAFRKESISSIYFEFGIHQKKIGQNFRQFYDFFKDHNFKIYKQKVGRNFFGLTDVVAHDPELSEMSSMWMIYATKLDANPDYIGPRVFQ